MNSRKTPGARRLRPRSCVCWVAIATSVVGTVSHPVTMTGWPPVCGYRYWPRGAKRILECCRRLLDVAGTLHFALGGRLGGGKRGIDRHSARERCGELLADGGADALEFRYRRILHADVRHRLHGRLVRISRVDRRQRRLRERGDLEIFRILVERGSRSGRHVGPALPGGNQLGVILAGSPRDELLRRGNLLGSGGDREIPGPQPVGVLAETGVRRERKADPVGYRGFLWISHERSRHRGIDPHRAFAGIEQREVFVEAVRAGTGRTG